MLIENSKTETIQQPKKSTNFVSYQEILELDKKKFLPKELFSTKKIVKSIDYFPENQINTINMNSY
jgi:hypothetical protein